MVKKLKLEFTPCAVYKEYRAEHVVPIKESLYALFDRFVGITGKIASIVITKTCKRGEGEENFDVNQ